MSPRTERSPSGSSATALSTSASLWDAALAGQVRGLLGDAGGDPANDLTSAAGELVDPKTAPGATADDPLYATFGDSWRVSATSSLFDYAPGTDTGTFTDRSVPQLGSDLDTVDKERREAAEAVCRGAGVSSQPFLNNCTLDIGVLDNPSFALSALRAQALSAVAAQTAGLAQPAPTATAAPGAPPAPASTPGGGTPLKVGDEAAGEIEHAMTSPDSAFRGVKVKPSSSSPSAETTANSGSP